MLRRYNCDGRGPGSQGWLLEARAAAAAKNGDWVLPGGENKKKSS